MDSCRWWSIGLWGSMASSPQFGHQACNRLTRVGNGRRASELFTRGRKKLLRWMKLLKRQKQGLRNGNAIHRHGKQSVAAAGAAGNHDIELVEPNVAAGQTGVGCIGLYASDGYAEVG